MSADTEAVPLVPQPSEHLATAAQTVATPALIYDLDAVDEIVRRLALDVSLVPRARLNVALKACHTPAVLQRLAGLGLGCDVASVGELALASAAGFDEISATGPAFSVDDLRAFRDAGIVPDVDSMSQLRTYGDAFPGASVGLRLRIAAPEALQTRASFWEDSRFGFERLSRELLGELARHRLEVTRLHVHTGQTTPAALRFKLDYLLAIADVLPAVTTIDLGGGFFHLYVNRAAARAALSDVAARVEDWSSATGRPLDLRFEPGAAVLATSGYLVCTVRAVERHAMFGRLVTIDASAWNLAPWHRPQVVVLGGGEETEQAVLAGNTLYEGDLFGRTHGDPVELEFATCAVGDRVLVTNAGAYTMTNARRFNRIEPPPEYGLAAGVLERLEAAA
ncbi:MAG: hypothetical protein AVDCRST_MAG85-1724 [uncultured Solirubrobacteraceae bacterium]|uniref:Orn/DAP/Arg decarboxylase 2 N-terminal domain-containing protein n=1 Tax=uncultured Solirubrobacteraceae bacterium TaxID=1162706 RepID=A0A6J4SPN7_9ACTN|nr:MAG: hypothetical protein AVDCRST_MAG85-1724 [uncultured Solirubrobacteraceae bacterium]